MSGQRTRLDILFCDKHLLVVDKPPGLPSVPARERSEASVLDLARDLPVIGQKNRDRVWPVHRLDLGTSGVLMFARSRGALRELNHLIGERKVRKSYLALCQGRCHSLGVIHLPLVVHRKRGRRKVQALTRYRRLAHVSGMSLMQLRPETGRTHQLRRHMRAIGNPVAGDARWGATRFNTWVKQELGLERLFLHCYRVEIPHPATGEPLTLTAPLPLALWQVLRRAGATDEQLKEVPLPGGLAADAPALPPSSEPPSLDPELDEEVDLSAIDIDEADDDGDEPER